MNSNIYANMIRFLIILIKICRKKQFSVPIKEDNYMFVCVEVLRPSQPNGVMSSAVSLPNSTFTGQA